MRRYFGDAFETVTTEDRDIKSTKNSDTGYLLIDKEPESYALQMTFRGQPQAEYITGSKFIVPFSKFQSPVMEKNEMELRNIRMPITRIIQTNLLYDMQEQEDLYFKSILDTAVTVTSNAATSSSERLTKADLRELINLVEQAVAYRSVHHGTTTLNDALEWQHNDIGDTVSEVVEMACPTTLCSGNASSPLQTPMSLNTVKLRFGGTRLLGRCGLFGQPILGTKKMDLLRMASWYYAGVNLGNIRGVARLRLASYVG